MAKTVILRRIQNNNHSSLRFLSKTLHRVVNLLLFIQPYLSLIIILLFIFSFYCILLGSLLLFNPYLFSNHKHNHNNHNKNSAESSSFSQHNSFLFVHASSVTTSYSIDLCDSSTTSSSSSNWMNVQQTNDSSSCVPSMQIVVTLDDTSPPLIGFQLPKNKIITDSQGRQWTVGENVLLEIERSPITVNYDLTFGGFAYNAYERIHAPSSNCMAMANQKCCPVTSGNNNMYFLREMKQNVTKYNYYYASMNSPQVSFKSINDVNSGFSQFFFISNRPMMNEFNPM